MGRAAMLVDRTEPPYGERVSVAWPDPAISPMTRSIFLVTTLALLLTEASGQLPGIHHWPLNEAEGNTAWDHVGAAHGTVVGNTSWDPAAGRFAGAARFDGASGRIQAGACDLTNGGGAFSISLWVKPDFVTGMERSLIAKANGPNDIVWSLTLVNATAIRFQLLTAGQLTEVATTPSLITSGTWYFIVGTYDGAHASIYVNGSLIASTVATGTIGHHPSIPVAMGALHGGQKPFSGWLDDVRIHDQALSGEEVLYLLFESVSVGVAPTPATAPVNWTLAEVLDVQGRLLGVVHPPRSVWPHTTWGLPSGGVYVVRWHSAEGVRTQRMFAP